MALTNATLPYVLHLAERGWQQAMRENPDIKGGANLVHGHVTYKGVAEAFGLPYTPVDEFLA
jgi:alanine dehydrogenase